MKIISICPICNNDFMYDPNFDYRLMVDINNKIDSKFTVQDDIWPSRFWTEDHSDYVDISGHVYICQYCHDERINAKDINIRGHRLCSTKGCPNDAKLSGDKYCVVCDHEKRRRS